MAAGPYIFNNADGALIQVQPEDHETFFFQITDTSSLVDVFRYNIKSETCYPEDLKSIAKRSEAITYFLEHFCFEIG